MFKNRQTKEGRTSTGQFITYGVKLLKIVDIEIKESKKSERIQHIFHVETPAIGGTFEGFERENGIVAEGLVGKVKLGIYFDPTATEGNDFRNKERFLDHITLMAEKAGVRELLNEFPDGMEWADMLEKFTGIIKDKYMWFLVAADEYDTGKYALEFGTMPMGKDENDKWIFTIVVKHADFHKTDGELIRDEETQNLIQVKGTNVVGENAGKKDIIKYDPYYHMDAYQAGDQEAASGLAADIAGADNDLPF